MHTQGRSAQAREKDMTRIFGLIGAGRFAREVMPVARMLLTDNAALYFVETTPHASHVNGVPVISEADFIAMNGEKIYSIAFSESDGRKAIAERLEGKAAPYSIIAPQSFLGDANELGEGMVLCPFTSITSNVRIGKHFQANIYSYVGHDCVIGDYVTFAPSVQCNGYVTIEDGAYIGTGAIIKQGSPDKPTVIGAGAIIGMGAVVTKSVAAGTTVVGNPAKIMEKN